MSFAIVKAGKTPDVVEETDPKIVQADDNDLESLTRKFIYDVLRLQGADGVIVEASGHSDSRATNVTVNIRPVF